jgi:hippurate hydrolase
MKLVPSIVDAQSEIMSWRRAIHSHPELAFEESRTSDFIAAKLENWGVKVTRGIGSTGIVGTLSVGSSNRCLGLRADIDALPIEELNQFPHRSQIPGRMHGCGHDGHTVMLLAAARHLSETKNFNGTVHFVFQPAEEANERGSGAKAMISDGLLDRFSMEAIFAMHNMPGIPIGGFSIHSGPVLASMDLFDVELSGNGTHGALPHTGTNSIDAACRLVANLNTIVSRDVDPMHAAVLSVTRVCGGTGYNTIPDTTKLRGSVRTFEGDVRASIENRVRALAHHTAAMHNMDVQIDFRRTLPPTVNDPKEAAFCKAVANEMVGSDLVSAGSYPARLMGSDDFAFFLEERPGAYILIGNGDGPAACMLHDSHYDFRDEIAPIGASFWVRLVERKLEK